MIAYDVPPPACVGAKNIHAATKCDGRDDAGDDSGDASRAHDG